MKIISEDTIKKELNPVVDVLYEELVAVVHFGSKESNRVLRFTVQALFR